MIKSIDLNENFISPGHEHIYTNKRFLDLKNSNEININ